MRKAALYVALLWAALLVIGCGGGTPPQAKSNNKGTTEVSGVSARVVAPAVSIDGGVVSAPYLYAYNPIGKRDPFRNFLDEAKTPGGETTALCNEPVCQWDLDQLKLVAVVSGEANPLAMVEDPNGVGYIVRRNTKIGKQGGKVTQILRDCLVVTEFWTGPDGKVNPNPVKKCVEVGAANEAAITDLSGSEKGAQ